MAHAAAFEIFKSGHRGIPPTKPPGLVANAKLGLQIAARAIATALERGHKGALYTQRSAKMDKAFGWYQDLMTLICLNKMVPHKTTPEEYVLKQVALATELAEKQAK
jgi:hypothetical protein